MNDTDNRKDPDGYNYDVVRQFTLITLVWDVLGMDLGMFIAAQLIWPALNLDLPWVSFGRIHPIHTSLVVFAFGGNALFATSFYVVWRTSGVRLISDALACFAFWDWQTAIVGMIVNYPLGYTTSKEYTEMGWLLALWMAIVWMVYAYLFFGTVARRKVKHIYVGDWFCGAFIIITAMVHVMSHALLPVSLGKSYSTYSGATGAIIQQQYRHSVVDFILSVGFLGMMYYFVPKQTGRPIHSYRLSIMHFWATISIYVWAGPYHLHYTALPDWIQSSSTMVSLVLLAPNWGNMINGMMTLSGAWHKLHNDPILRFLVVSLAFYGISTFEGPVMAIETVNSLSHYTDWTIGHAHIGALGRVTMIFIGTLYHMVPKLWDHERMHSIGLINTHFWLATIGTILHIASMWVNDITQDLIWRAVNRDGALICSSIEALVTSHPGYMVRLLGGATFASGMLLIAYNTWRTLRNAQEQQQPVLAAGQGA